MIYIHMWYICVCVIHFRYIYQKNKSNNNNKKLKNLRKSMRLQRKFGPSLYTVYSAAHIFNFNQKRKENLSILRSWKCNQTIATENYKISFQTKNFYHWEQNSALTSEKILQWQWLKINVFWFLLQIEQSGQLSGPVRF